MVKRRVGLSLAVVCLGVWSGALSAPQPSPLTLGQAITLALGNSSEVWEAELNLTMAQLELAAAKVFLPQVRFQVQPFSLSPRDGFPGTAQGQLSMELAPFRGADLSFSLSPAFNWATGTLSMSWELSFSYRYDPVAALSPNQVELREESVRSAEDALEQTKNKVALEVIGRFSELLAKEAAVALAEAKLSTAQARLAGVTERVKAGLAGALDRLEAELAVKEAEITFRKRSSEYALARGEFKALLGIEGEYELVPPELSVDEILARAKELLALDIPWEAVQANGNVQRAQDALDNAERQLRATQAAALPVVSLSAGLRPGNEMEWGIGLTFLFNLFSPERPSQLKLAQASVELAQARLEVAEQEAMKAIWNQKTALQQALEDLELLQLEEAKWDLEETIMREKLEADVISVDEWEDFQLRKRGFERDREQRVFNLVLAYLRHRQILGLKVGWEEILP
ncbi:MAG: TolC family protein [Candidatus Acetothermia bacterium]|nr:TolC family protein [Candidatus Acetothermia bacterium]